MSKAVLDASALLALLKDEPGAAEVAEVIAEASMSSVNYAEVVSHFVHAGMPIDQVEAMLRPLPLTIVDADRIIVLDAGRVAETGTHAELLRAGGLYAELWARQAAERALEEAAE